MPDSGGANNLNEVRELKIKLARKEKEQKDCYLDRLCNPHQNLDETIKATKMTKKSLVENNDFEAGKEAVNLLEETLNELSEKKLANEFLRSELQTA